MELQVDREELDKKFEHLLYKKTFSECTSSESNGLSDFDFHLENTLRASNLKKKREQRASLLKDKRVRNQTLIDTHNKRYKGVG